MDYFWKIADGRIWSSATAGFVGEVPPEEPVISLYANGIVGDVEYLRNTIMFYGFNLGELKNRLEKVQDIQTEYAPQLTALQEAYAAAQMLGNGETEEFQQEYKQLLREMQEKIQGVPND